MVEFVNTSAGEIAYQVQGSGEPLLLIPGFLGSSAGWLMAGYPDHLTDFQLILIDPLGHGASAKSYDPSDYSIANTVEQVCAVLDAVGVERVAAVGFSRGGLIAAQLTSRAPERVSAAVFGGVPLGRAVKFVLEQQRAGLEPLRSGDWETYWRSFPVPIPPAMQDAFSQSNDPRALAAALEAMLEWGDEEPDLGVADSSVPRLAYFGTGEVFADVLRDTLNECGLRYVERDWSGHAETMMDAAGVSTIIREFLAST